MKDDMDITNATWNRGKRRFRHGEHDNRAATVRGGCRRAALLAVLGLAVLTPRGAVGSLSVDVGTQTLIGNDSTPQTIQFYVNNNSSSTTVGSLDFYIELGSGTGSTPSISSVDLLTGTIFSSGSQSADSGNLAQLQHYGALKGSGPGPQILAGQSLLATVSFVTTGTASGNFSLSLSPSAGTTVYYSDATSPTNIDLSIVNGTLNVVPEPVNVALPIFGGLALLAGGLRGRRRRKASIC